MPLRGNELPFQEKHGTGLDGGPRYSVQPTRSNRRLAATKKNIQEDDTSDGQTPRNNRNMMPSKSSRPQLERRRGKQGSIVFDDDDDMSDSPDISRYITKKEVCDFIDGWTVTMKEHFEKKWRVRISLFDSDRERFLLLRGSEIGDVVKAKKTLIGMSKEESSEEIGAFSVFLEVPTDVFSSNIVLRKIGDIERDTNTFVQRKRENDKLTHLIVMADVQADLDDAIAELSTVIKNALKSARRNKPKSSNLRFVESGIDESMESNEVLPPAPNNTTPAQEVKIVDPAYKKYPKTMNILVLGESGVGKSTFINGLANYLEFNSMQEALERGGSILTDSAFFITDDNYRSHKIVTKSIFPEESSSNETMDPKAYVHRLGEGAEAKSIRFIDTPGIRDTRGLEQDKKNFEKIISFIADYEEIHAILILVKPNTARLTADFRFCIDELLFHLHKSASKNILFCFTNTRSTLYKPGDTLPALKEHLEKLEKDRGIVIPLNKSSLFSFDNEGFRFLCAHKSGFPFTNAERLICESSWVMATKESLRLFDRICELPVHKVYETLCLNNTRSAFTSLSKPLADITRNLMINIKLIEEKMKEVDDKDVENIKINKESTVKTTNVDQLKADSQKITNYCAEIASFLSANSILPYNDSYKQYIEHFIKEEKEKERSGITDEILNLMEKHRDQYVEMTKKLQSPMQNRSTPPRSVAYINLMVNELRTMVV